jgi:hypothetical protein
MYVTIDFLLILYQILQVANNPCNLPVNRVTRSGEFSPIGRLLSLGSFLEFKEVAQAKS